MNILRAFIRTAFYDAFIYKVDFWLAIPILFVRMYASYSIWSILYQQSPDAFGVGVEQMTTYGVLGVLLLTVMDAAQHIQHYIAMQVREGKLELDLMKPLDFMFHMFGRSIGIVSVLALARLLPSLILAVLFLDFRPPVSLQAGLAFLLSLVLGYLIFFCASFMFGLLSIITLDIRSYDWAYRAIIRFVSGQIVPLWMFPPVLAAVAAVLPFQAVFATPMSIYIGLYEDGLSKVLLSQLAWLIGLLVAARFFWLRVQRRITIQGG